MKEKEAYELWRKKAVADDDLIPELVSIEEDADGIFDRFYKNLEFGTAGLRGVIGAGTNRMNVYTIGAATQGLADYLSEKYEKARVAIAYDSRIKSDRFAREAASILAANGIEVYIYPELMPTPMLSFAVRQLKCQSGIVVTASHNPSKYNGYKCYGPDGCQMTSESADAVYEKIKKVDYFTGIHTMDFEDALDQGKIHYIGKDLYDLYLDKVMTQQVNPGVCQKAGLKIVYTPLNGTGNKPVRDMFRRLGVTDVTVVPEQEMPNGKFTTCPFPNPEIEEALHLGLELSKQVKPDLLIATDPDCDRMGIAAKEGDGYQLITGNEVGALLLEYICKSRVANGTMPKHPVSVKTIVTSTIIDAIGKEYGVEIIDVLTGFKYIGEQVGLLEAKGEEDRFIFGFEESYGYNAGSYVRDKDGVVASMLICEMAAYYKEKGMTVVDALRALYEKYGNYLSRQTSFYCEGASGMQRMADIMAGLRKDPPKEIGGFAVQEYADYQLSFKKDAKTGQERKVDLPKSNVLGYTLENGASVIVRPSGTEPKIKTYYTIVAPTMEEAEALHATIAAATNKLLGF